MGDYASPAPSPQPSHPQGDSRWRRRRGSKRAGWVRMKNCAMNVWCWCFFASGDAGKPRTLSPTLSRREREQTCRVGSHEKLRDECVALVLFCFWRCGQAPHPLPNPLTRKGTPVGRRREREQTCRVGSRAQTGAAGLWRGYFFGF